MKNKEPNILYRDCMNLLTQSNEIIRLQNELIKYYKKSTYKNIVYFCCSYLSWGIALIIKINEIEAFISYEDYLIVKILF